MNIRNVFCTFACFCGALTAVYVSSGLSVVAAQQQTTTYMSSASELMWALAQGRGGKTIVLQPGDYGDLVLHSQRHPFVKFADPVTIKSADLQNLASFKSVRLIGVENLSFEFVKFDYVTEGGAADWARPFDITGGSRNITIADSMFDGDIGRGRGDAVDGYGTGYGLNVRNAANVTVKRNKFFNWARAGVFYSVNNLNIIGNDVYNIRSDGFNFVGVDDVLIEGNHIHDFITAPGSRDHPDMIQFWTTGTTAPSANIVIRGNILNSGRGGWTQSIFMRNGMVDTGRAGDEMFYRNITIEGNVIYNGHAHGITVGETHGLTIRNNTLLRNRATGDDKLVHVPRINLKAASTGVQVMNNIVQMVGDESSIHPSAATGNVRNNLHVQRDRPGEPNYYGRLFVNALADGEATLADLQALPGGLVEQMGVGSRLTRFNERPDAPSGFILHQPGFALSSLRHNFNARNLFGPQGRIDSKDAAVAWDFGDGSSGEGLATSHTYAQAGRYVVKANVTLADGRVIHLKRTIVVVPPAPGTKSR